MEDGKVPAKESRNWKIEGLKKNDHEDRKSEAIN